MSLSKAQQENITLTYTIYILNKTEANSTDSTETLRLDIQARCPNYKISILNSASAKQ
jgi:hypothetical protein